MAGWGGPGARALAAWAMERMVNRRDCHGTYRSGRAYTSKQLVTEEVLHSHFLGESVIGLHAIGDGVCRWCCFDIDAHNGERAEENMRTALELAARIRDRLGFDPIIEDSDGRGGLHLWVLFESPAPSESVHAFCRDVARNLRVEFFPKQARVEPGGWGSWVRLPGRHHSRDHWSRFCVAGEWYEGDDAADWLVGQAGGPIDRLPERIEHDGRGGSAAHCSPGEGVDELDDDSFMRAVSALRALPQKYCDEYDLWLRVGMALHAVDQSEDMLAVWDRWSMRSSRYEHGVCAEKWRTFHGQRDNGVGLGSLIHWAGGSAQAEDDLARLEKVVSAERRRERESENEMVMAASPPVTATRAEAVEIISRLLGVRIERIIQRGVDSGYESYAVVIEGSEVLIGRATALLNLARFRAAVFVATRRVVRVTPKQWSRIVANFGLLIDVEEIEEDAPSGQLAGWLAEYFEHACGQHAPLPTTDEQIANAIAHRTPFVRDGRLWVHVPRLLSWARVSGIRINEPHKLLRWCGWEPRKIQVGGEQQRYWCVVLDSPSVPEQILHRRSPAP